MSSATIRAKLVSILQALALFDDADVTDSDWRVLDRGSSPYAVVYTESAPETLDDQDEMGRQVLLRYATSIDVIAKWTPDEQTAISTAMDAVYAQLRAYPQLEDLAGVLKAYPAADPAPFRYLYHSETDAQPQFAIVTLTHYSEVWEFYGGQGEFAE